MVDRQHFLIDFMKFFLTSSGIPTADTQKFFEYVGLPANKIKLAYIPTAGDPEIDRSWQADLVKDFGQMGMTVERYDIKGKNAAVLRKDLSAFNVIFVDGGNTFYLLDHARKSSFVDALKDLLQDNSRTYVGVSAGSILVGPSIELAGWRPFNDNNVVGLTDLTGLNLVDVAVFPHYKEEYAPLIKDFDKDVKYQIIALPDESAVMINDGKIAMIGEYKYFGKKLVEQV